MMPRRKEICGCKSAIRPSIEAHTDFASSANKKKARHILTSALNNDLHIPVGECKGGVDQHCPLRRTRFHPRSRSGRGSLKMTAHSMQNPIRLVRRTEADKRDSRSSLSVLFDTNAGLATPARLSHRWKGRVDTSEDRVENPIASGQAVRGSHQWSRRSAHRDRHSSTCRSEPETVAPGAHMR